MNINTLTWLLTWSSLPIGLIAPMAQADNVDLAVGERIYLEGKLPSGEVIRSFTQGDIELSGTQVSCVNCHKHSGQGSSESRFQVPAVTEAALFERREIGRKEKTLRKFGSVDNSILMENQRPIYTVESLRRAIVEGIDPDGRVLDPLMPRFQLQSAALDSLIAYMRTLSHDLSPGVDSNTIRFATIVAGKVNATKKQYMLDIIDRYFEDKNVVSRNDIMRRDQGPWHKEPQFSAYRTWVLDVWELHGAPDSWAKQLASVYDKTPVFAVIGGLSEGTWAPIHDFCQTRKIPCVLPNAYFEGAKDTDFYNVYFSKGTSLEAETLANHLKKSAAGTINQVVQVYPDNTDMHQVASAFGDNIDKTGIRLIDVPLAQPQQPDALFWKDLAAKYPGATLATWLNAEQLQQAGETVASFGNIYLSGTLVAQNVDQLPVALRNKALMIYPFELPAKRNLARTFAWARLKKIEVKDEAILANSYFVLGMITDVIKHLQHNLYRDYFLERVEHMADRAVTPSIFPRVSMAPGQRFMSKGAYIVKIDPEAKDGLTPVTDWITP